MRVFRAGDRLSHAKERVTRPRPFLAALAIAHAIAIPSAVARSLATGFHGAETDFDAPETHSETHVATARYFRDMHPTMHRRRVQSITE
jgi:hypothetical protein